MGFKEYTQANFIQILDLQDSYIDLSEIIQNNVNAC